MDVIEQLQLAAEVIGCESSSKESKISSLDTILNYVDDIDTSIDFCKIGGLFVLLRSLNSPYSEIRNKSALLVAELAQNNPFCQEKLLEAGILPKLMNLLNEKETAVNGIRALSCLIRGHEPCFKAFIENGRNIECLLGCFQRFDQVLRYYNIMLNLVCSTDLFL